MKSPEPVNPYVSPAIIPELRDADELLALKRLRGPSLGLLIMAGSLAATGIFFVPLAFIRLWLDGFMPPNLRDPGQRSVVLWIMGIIASYPIVIGAWQMRRGKNYRLALMSAVLACAPIISPCGGLGIPLGIWALVVLHRKDVKAVFAARAAEKRGGTG